MIVYNLDILSTSNGPPNADPILIIYPNAVPSSTIALERFELITRWYTEIFQSSCDL